MRLIYVNRVGASGHIKNLAQTLSGQNVVSWVVEFFHDRNSSGRKSPFPPMWKIHTESQLGEAARETIVIFNGMTIDAAQRCPVPVSVINYFADGAVSLDDHVVKAFSILPDESARAKFSSWCDTKVKECHATIDDLLPTGDLANIHEWLNFADEFAALKSDDLINWLMF